MTAAKMLADDIGETTGEQVSLPMLLSFAMTSDGDKNQVRANGNFLGKVREFEIRNEALVLQYPPRLISGGEDFSIHSLLNQIANKNVSMSILSNTSFIKGDLLRRVLDSETLRILRHFKFTLFSDELGVCKPMAHPYTQVRVQGNPAKPIKILHVGDNPYADYTHLFDCYIIGPDKPISKILNLI